MRDRLYSLLGWIIVIPFIPYWIVSTIYYSVVYAIKACKNGETREEALEKAMKAIYDEHL